LGLIPVLKANELLLFGNHIIIPRSVNEDTCPDFGKGAERKINGSKIAIEFQNSKSEKTYRWGAKPFS